MITALSKSKFWVAANVAGMGVYFYMACQTWNIDSALGSGFPLITVCLCLWLLLYVAVNLTWFIVIAARIWRHRAWLPLVIWMSGVALWAIAIRYDKYRFAVEVEQAGKL
jgi:hypothetical protein